MIVEVTVVGDFDVSGSGERMRRKTPKSSCGSVAIGLRGYDIDTVDAFITDDNRLGEIGPISRS
jgi:hypothetical protein